MSKKNKREANHRLEPSFSAQSTLARFVHPHFKKGERLSSAAFLPNPGEDHLSVNSLEVESLPTIAEHYRRDLQKDEQKVAIACRKVYAYNKGASVAGISVIRNQAIGKWMFLHEGAPTPAYKLRATPLSMSHSGVEFIRAFHDEISKKRFSRRMAGHPPGRVHLL